MPICGKPINLLCHTRKEWQSDKNSIGGEFCFSYLILVNVKSTIVARLAEKVQPLRNWTSFAVPNGQVVYRGLYYFAWNRGRFIGAYDSLDDAVESLEFRNKKPR
jgi:hypothetical protein